MPRKKKNKESDQEFIKRISREVDSWPKWKKDLSALGSKYCSELHPFVGESQKEYNKRMRVIAKAENK